MVTRSAIQSLAPQICPQCSGENTFAITGKHIECRRCGYVHRHANGARQTTDEAVLDTAPNHDEPTYSGRIAERPDFQAGFGWLRLKDVDAWASAAFETAQDAIHRKDWDEALNALYRAVDNQRDFVEAHLWIAYVTADPDEREDRLSTVLSYQPNHADAIRELMVLRGELTPGEAGALQDPYMEPQTRSAGGAVGLETDNVRCPQCNAANMAMDAATGLVTCGSCGYVDRSAGAGGTGSGTLTKALLKRRAQPVKWVVGEHLLACESCGAQRTIPARKLAHECPFCASNHVIKRDVLDSFQQPDGVVPFQVNRSAAKEAIKAKLGNWWERFKGWFNDNTLDRAALTPAYLPYWVFDATVEVRRTITRSNQANQYDRNRQTLTQVPAYQSYVVPDAMHNVMVCGVNSPERLLTNRLGKFRLDKVRAYSPKLLTRVVAEIYQIDFDEASLKARSTIAREMRAKHGTSSEYGASVSVFPSVQAMTFQLVLIPVWISTLHERDGDVRTALVNGQTGHVVLNKPRKPRRV